MQVIGRNQAGQIVGCFERQSGTVVGQRFEAGIRVVAADSTEHTLAGASRFAAASAHYPDPLDAPERFLQRLNEICGDLDVDRQGGQETDQEREGERWAPEHGRDGLSCLRSVPRLCYPRHRRDAAGTGDPFR